MKENKILVSITYENVISAKGHHSILQKFKSFVNLYEYTKWRLYTYVIMQTNNLKVALRQNLCWLTDTRELPLSHSPQYRKEQVQDVQIECDGCPNVLIVGESFD